MALGFLTCVIAILSGLTIVGTVAYFFAQKYDLSFTCYLFAAIFWGPFIIMDWTRGGVSLAADIVLIVGCVAMAVMSNYKLDEEIRWFANRKAELLNWDKTEGTFVMQFFGDGITKKAEEYIKNDSPIDEHDVIVCGNIIAVCTNSIDRSTGLASELLNLFNYGNKEGKR